MAESPDPQFDNRSRNFTDTAILVTNMRAFRVHDVEVGNSNSGLACIRVLQNHLWNLIMIDTKPKTKKSLTLTVIQLNQTTPPPSKGLSGAHGVYSTG